MCHTCTKAKETILVVEDDEDLRDLAAAMLTRLGYSVLEARDGPSALQLLGSGCQNIDLVFSDICMPPHMNGFELASEINNRYPEIRVLLTTGMQKALHGEAGGATIDVRVLPKPYRMADLESALQDAMNAGQ